MEPSHTPKFSIKQWAEEDRPREKLLTKGRAALTEAELIAILIGSGTQTVSAVELARAILHSVDNNLNQLAKLSVKDLMKFNGIGEAKAITIVSAMELGRRRKPDENEKKRRFISARTTYDEMLPELQDLDHEQFWILLLKRNNELIRKVQVSTGGVSGVIVDHKIVFKHAIDHLASSIVLVHNHPSGNLKPSEQDKRLTKRIVEAARLLDITVNDHLIISDRGYYSFADEGEL